MLAKEIAASGVKTCFGIPGSGTTLDLLHHLEKLGVRIVIPSGEGAAAIMAGTSGRLSGSPGLAFSIRGPGVTNLVPGLAFCAWEALPMLALTESVLTQDGTPSPHKYLDAVAVCRTITKAAIKNGNSTAALSTALRTAASERPGPVLLQLEGPGAPDDDLPSGHLGPAQSRTTITPAQEKEIVRSAFPLVVAGSFVARAQLGSLLSRLQVPVLTTPSGKGATDERSPHSAGVFTGVDGALTPASSLLNQADLAIGIGVHSSELLALPSSKETRWLFLGPSDLNVTDEDRESKGISLTQLPRLLDGKDWGVESIMSLKRELRMELLGRPFSPAHAYSQVQAALGTKVRLVTDTGLFAILAEYLWETPATDQFLGPTSSRTMGAGLPMAIAAALHDRETPVVLAVGDGGIPQYLADLRIAVREQLPLLVVSMGDRTFGSIQRVVKKKSLRVTSLESQGEWREIVRSFDIPVMKATGEGEVERTVSAWSPSSGPAFIDVSFDESDYRASIDGLGQ
ncbi:MAG TPA: thiamine pyrophosphate-binding protein [Actinomycetota bacterium]|nr:thiamine pyrophosphate-binding protein [Actinomycetota bacterium]